MQPNTLTDGLNPIPVRIAFHAGHPMPEFHSGNRILGLKPPSIPWWFHPHRVGLEQDEKSGGRAGMECPAPHGRNVYGLKNQPSLKEEILIFKTKCSKYLHGKPMLYLQELN
ncbi:hypothetical protein C5O19_19990 [Siphonobacter curvatus]|uniref:Uncharacterized protein n=1 Tax=Siphonobacter curvatus TaxID=2094562 RepID=A0A2S7II53_9BACT|nr:hypothetical protein C5O19_19990 [Siphonobacter curvatus]